MKNVPNILSSLRILLAPVFILLYLQDEAIYQSLSIAVFVFAALTDYFDGYIAKNFNAGSKLGVFLDPLADKVLTFSGFIVLPLVAPDVFPMFAVAIIVIRDIVVTMMRMVADRRGIEMATRKSAKFKTMVQMIFLYVALLAGLFLYSSVFPGEEVRWLADTGILTWTLYAVTALTVYTGIEYIIVNIRIFFVRKTL